MVAQLYRSLLISSHLISPALITPLTQADVLRSLGRANMGLAFPLDGTAEDLVFDLLGQLLEGVRERRRKRCRVLEGGCR
jgi:hypothetical protein